MNKKKIGQASCLTSKARRLGYFLMNKTYETLKLPMKQVQGGVQGDKRILSSILVFGHC
jgi:hypothetical protein